jgi:hypothetical protein
MDKILAVARIIGAAKDNFVRKGTIHKVKENALLPT